MTQDNRSSADAQTQIVFTPLPIVGMVGCGIPVVPGTTNTDAPMDERTELCAIDANWIVGSAPTCDIHVKFVCELTGIDWPDLIAETGRDMSHAERPAHDRQRHDQDATREELARFYHGGDEV